MATSTARSFQAASTSQAGSGSNGMPSLRAKSLPRPPGRMPSTPSVPWISPATAPVSPSPPMATGASPAASAPWASSRACSIEVVRSTRKANPRARSAASARGRLCAARPPPAFGLTIRQRGRTERETVVGPPVRGPQPALRPHHERAVHPGPGGAGDVGVDAVADGEAAAGAEPVAGRVVHGRLRLADGERGGRLRGHLDRGQERAGGGALPVPHGGGAGPRDADELGAAEHRLRRDAQLPVVEGVVRGDHHEVGARGELRVVDDPQAGSRHVLHERGRADDEGRAAVAARGQGELERRAAGDDLVHRGLEPEAPEPAHEVLRRVAGVVGEEGDALAGLAQRGDRSRRLGDGRVAHPEAAVEVEQHVVVAVEGRIELHGEQVSSPAMPRLPSLLLACLSLALFSLAACGDDEETEAGSAPEATATATATPEDTGGEQGSGCETVDRPEPKPADVPKPKERLDPAKAYVATVTTNCGVFTITLGAKRAPTTGGAFKAIADAGDLDRLSFHRIVPGFVIQGGDPNGDGTGGPKWSIVEAPPGDLAYTKGVVAMAKTATEAAGTSGSQFFVVTGEDAGLPPDYALLGEVTEGIEVVDLIGVAPVGPDEQPTEPIVMESVTVSEE